ncbi:MAG TPA: acyl-CoA dehydrogenase family protein, partial [Vicinamibacteria bacterium]
MKSPFLESRHEVLAEKVRTFGDKRLRPRVRGETEVEAEARELVTAMGVAGLLAAAVPPPQGIMDLRSLVVVREGLAYFSGLADASFATQALGCLPIALAGTEVQRNRWLPAVAAGDMLAAF